MNRARDGPFRQGPRPAEGRQNPRGRSRNSARPSRSCRATRTSSSRWSRNLNAPAGSRTPTHLFQRTVALYETICREFPNSALYHNNLAWMAASLDRELDMALAHAQRAVQLEPDKCGIPRHARRGAFPQGQSPRGRPPDEAMPGTRAQERVSPQATRSFSGRKSLNFFASSTR